MTYSDFISKAFYNRLTGFKARVFPTGYVHYNWRGVPLKMPKNIKSIIPVIENIEVTKLEMIVNGKESEGKIFINGKTGNIEMWGGDEFFVIEDK